MPASISSLRERCAVRGPGLVTGVVSPLQASRASPGHLLADDWARWRKMENSPALVTQPSTCMACAGTRPPLWVWPMSHRPYHKAASPALLPVTGLNSSQLQLHRNSTSWRVELGLLFTFVHTHSLPPDRFTHLHLVQLPCAPWARIGLWTRTPTFERATPNPTSSESP